jgi:hypothetical protein
MQKQRFKFSNKQERSVKNMAINEFPIGQLLKAVSIIEYKGDAGNKLSLEKIQLFFQDTIITLLPIVDTDEIEIILENTTNPGRVDTPSWCQSFIGKTLMTVWVCDNDQGYRDQVIFAFEYLHPSLAFVAECSSLIVFRAEPIYRVQASENDLHYSQAS